MKKINLLAVVVAGVFAVACNGGSSSTPEPSPTETPPPTPITPTSCLPADGCNYVQANGQWESIATASLSVTGTGQNVSFTSGESFITIAMPISNSSSKSLSSTAVVSSRPVNDVCNPPNQNHNFVIVNGTCQLLPDGQNYAIVTIPGDAFVNGNYSVYTSINGSWSSFNSYTNPNWTILPNNGLPPIRLTNESAVYYNGNDTTYNTSLINSITSTNSLPRGINMPYAGLSSLNVINYWDNAITTDIDFSNSSMFCEVGGGMPYSFSLCDPFLSTRFPSGVTSVSSSLAVSIGSDGYIYAGCTDYSVAFTKLNALGNGNVEIANKVRKDQVTTDSVTYLSTSIYTITKSNNAVLQITEKLTKEDGNDHLVSNLCSLYK